MKRGSITKKNCELIAFWLPTDIRRLLDEAVQRTDTDRSKFLRAALREKLTSANCHASAE